MCIHSFLLWHSMRERTISTFLPFFVWDIIICYTRLSNFSGIPCIDYWLQSNDHWFGQRYLISLNIFNILSTFLSEKFIEITLMYLSLTVWLQIYPFFIRFSSSYQQQNCSDLGARFIILISLTLTQIVTKKSPNSMT